MDLSILSLLAQATLVAKAVLVALLFMSVFSWALMFRKWMNIRAALKKAADGMDRFNHARDLREAVQSLGGDPDSPLYTVAHEGVTARKRPGTPKTLWSTTCAARSGRAWTWK